MATPTIPLLSGLQEFDRIKKLNPQLADMADNDLATLAYKQSGDPRLKTFLESGTMSRGFARGAEVLDHAGRALGTGARSAVTELGGGQFLQALAGNLGQQAPRTAMHLGIFGAGKVLAPLSKLANWAAPAVGMGTEYGLTKAETGDEKAALGAAASMPLSYLGSSLGSKVGGKFGKPIGLDAIGRYVGSTAGTAAGDLVEVGTSDPSKGFIENVRDFVNDPVQLTSYVLQETLLGGGMEFARSVGEQLKSNREKTIRETVDLDASLAKTDAEKLAALSKKPVAMWTEQEAKSMEEMRRKERQATDYRVQAEMAQKKDAVVNPEQEPLSALHQQYYMTAQGKRPVFMVPKGTPFTTSLGFGRTLPPTLNQLVIDGDRFYYDPSKTNEAQIKQARADGTLGTLLGYGIPSEPANATKAVVLRSARGNEKLAVMTDDANEGLVTESLRKLANPEDLITTELKADLLKKRAQAQSTIKTFSLKRESSELPTEATDAFDRRADDYFYNSLLRKSKAAFTETIKGLRVKGAAITPDAEGNVGSKGLRKLVQKSVPPEIYNHLVEQGLDTLLTPNKVNKDVFARWVRENMPQVEVKKLLADNTRGEYDRARHELETLGYSFAAGDELGAFKENTWVPYAELPADVQARVQKVHSAREEFYNKERYESDAATGRYGVEPFFVNKMDRPVDILVRVPLEQGTQSMSEYQQDENGDVFVNKNAYKEPLYQGPHFGDSDVNVVCFVRGFMRGDTFVVFEVQKDWKKGHVLLSSYETIAVKSAIKHALEQGATKIAFSDGESASMIEKHDLYLRDGKNVQEGGMRQHYDLNLPNIARKLTGDRGRPVNYGPMDREASTYFNGKTDFTAREFSLDNLNSSVDDLFSLYGTPEQIDFDAQVASVEEAIKSGETLSTQEFLQRTLAGESVDMAILAKFITSIAHDGANIRTFGLDAVDGMLIKGYNEANTAAVNIKAQDVKGAFATAGHELAHVATYRFKDEKPEAYAMAHSWLNSQTGEQRRVLLDQIADTLGVDKALIDLDYVAGMRFSPDTKNLQELNTYEFVAGVTEMLAHASYNEAKLPGFFKAIQWLPDPVYKMVVNAFRQLRTYFNTGSAGMPSALTWLSDKEQAKLSQAIQHVSRIVFNNETKDLVAYTKLQALNAFDPQMGAKDFGSEEAYVPVMQNLGALASSDFRAFSLENIKQGGFWKRVGDRWEDSFLSSLFRSELFPHLQPIFHEERHFRSKIKEMLHGYIGYIGQNADNTLTLEESLRRSDEILQRFTRPDVNQKARLNRASRIIDENQKRAKAWHEQNNTPVPESEMVTVKQMQEEFGASPEEADAISRIVKIPQMVMEQHVRMLEQIDNSYLTKLLFEQNKGMKLEDVEQRAQVLTRLAGDVGVLRFQRQYYERILANLERNGVTPDWAETTKQEIAALAEREKAGKLDFENEARRLFEGQINFAPEVGKDPFLSQLAEFAVRTGGIRAQNKFMSKDAGYAPMTRRGRFLVRVLRTDVEGYELGLLKEAVGFNTEKEVREYLKKNQLSEGEYEVLDKDNLKDRYSMYTPHSLKLVQARAKEELGELADQLTKEYANSPQAEQIKNVLNEMVLQYKPIEDDVREILAVKGDKFAERRWNVPGFDVNDYIPNIFEYANYKTVQSVKELTRAKIAMHLAHPEFDKDVALKNRTQLEANYVLGNTKEWGGVRALAFNWYLGASFRHFFQNVTQIPMTGISQMVQQGAGLHAYAHWMKSMKMASQYLLFGKTGDANLDVLIKQAEKSGVTIPNAIEMFAPTTDKVQSALDSFSKWEKGDSVVGARVKYEASRFMDSFSKVMMATASASEIANRRVAFIMSYLESKRTGETDLRKMYQNAERFTDLSNFVGDKSNRPGFMIRQGFGADGKPLQLHGALLTATSMQSFVMNHVGQLYTFAKQSGIFRNKDFSNPDAKALATGVAHLLFFAGAFGLVGAELAEQIFEKFTGISLKTAIRKGIVKSSKELFDMDAEAGGRLADGALGGFPGLLGIDGSQSLGLGSPLVNYKADRELSALDVAGPVGGLVGKAYDAGDILARNPNEWMRAARVLAPQALNYWMRLHDLMAKDSYLDRRMQPITEGASGKDLLATAMGFNTLSVGKARAVQTAVRKNREAVANDYRDESRIIGQLLHDFETKGDQRSLQEARTRSEAFLAKYPTQNPSSFVDSIVGQIQQFQAPYTQEPTAKEVSGFRKAYEAYPEVKPRFASHLDAAFESLKVAQLLGQEQVLMSKAESLVESLPEKVMYDSLIRGGSLPPQARALSTQHKSLQTLLLLQALSDQE